MRTGIIIQARMGSTRLPHKMILPFHENKGILEVLISRLKKEIDEHLTPIVLATTTNTTDNEIERIGNLYDLPVFRGSENDVLERFILAAEKFSITNIIRVCADNPLLDMNMLRKLILKSEQSNSEYYSFATSESKPTILTAYGFWAEAVKLSALKKVSEMTNDKLYREHVTNFIYTHPNEFAVDYEYISPEIEKENKVRLTVDTEVDFKLVKNIFKILMEENISFSSDSIVRLVASRQDWIEQMEIELQANKK